ncbi:hypothetical protein [Geobacter sp. AOG1]|uniref:hypothetical protein n=1 Tax=Geobacter sp. AOG1 TaxID=1566346 RepID=UPI001CC3832E|nr:hypothetical protein [Geobacter sp. AOG1]GFE59088.1 hypothetical protein AOG1_29680 [Geobacter sp. AOG1]
MEKKSVLLLIPVFLFVAFASASFGDGSATNSRTTQAKAAKTAIRKATGPNAVTVEEAYRDSIKLDGKVVVIRGKVVKVTAGIMDKNWVHIQDGTGSSANGTYDLTCTTSDPLPAKDTVVTLTGTLARNRDFGAGYFYSVIVENASFSKK